MAPLNNHVDMILSFFDFLPKYLSTYLPLPRHYLTLKDAGGGVKVSLWQIMVSGHSNFGTDQTNSVSYES